MIKPQTLKGFRDFLPEEAAKRQYVIDALISVFELYGFSRLETPALEYEDVLIGKYGDEGDKLMYRFVDHGGRKVALRYDQTVPFSRVIAQYQNVLPVPFKRYQIQPVYRAENTQKGRFREFLQCDADIAGTQNPLSDAEVIALSIMCLQKLGFTSFKALINDRATFEGLSKQAIITIDKLKKIGQEGVVKELVKKGTAKDVPAAKQLLAAIEDKMPTERLKNIFTYLEKLGIEKARYVFSPTLARGLDYYTSTIFEIEVDGYSAGSVCGGGRYDDLIGLFSGNNVPAVGFAFGFDRIMDAMEELGLFPQNLTSAKVLVTIFMPELKENSLEIVSKLRSKNIPAELYLNEEAPLEKQLKYADQKSIPYAVILGPNELSKNVVSLRNMKTRKQQEISINDLSNALI